MPQVILQREWLYLQLPFQWFWKACPSFTLTHTHNRCLYIYRKVSDSKCSQLVSVVEGSLCVRSSSSIFLQVSKFCSVYQNLSIPNPRHGRGTPGL